MRRSTCFRRFYRPSSGAQNCTYSVRYLSDRYCYLFFKFLYFCETLYMFQTVFPSIIRSSKLHIQRQVFVRPLLLPADRLAAGSSNGLTNRQVGTYLPMKMEQTHCSERSAYKIQTPRNCPEEITQHSETFASCWLYSENILAMHRLMNVRSQICCKLYFCNVLVIYSHV